MATSPHLAARLDELEEAKPHIVDLAGRSIGIILSKGEIFAVRNVCPHKRAPICRGLVRGTMLPSDPGTFVFGMEDRVLQCPWHGWEFDLTTGNTVAGEEDKKLTFYPARVEDGAVYVEI